MKKNDKAKENATVGRKKMPGVQGKVRKGQGVVQRKAVEAPQEGLPELRGDGLHPGSDSDDSAQDSDLQDLSPGGFPDGDVPGGGVPGIIWHLEYRSIGDLIEWERNPRRLTEKQAADLHESLSKFGVVEPLVLNFDGKSIIGGHQRRKVLLYMAQLDPTKEIPVMMPSRELMPEEAEELALRLNRNTGEWDYEMLANNFDTPKLFKLGFDPKEFSMQSAVTTLKPTSLKPAAPKVCPKCGTIIT